MINSIFRYFCKPIPGLNTKAKVKLDMYLRPNIADYKKVHPTTKAKIERMTAPLPPLSYKLQDIPEGYNWVEPLGLKQDIPFSIHRSKSNNLPIYRDYKQKRAIKLTIIKNISGDIEKFIEEVKKITSNSEIIQKTGSVVIKGLHKKAITNWLTRLGF